MPSLKKVAEPLGSAAPRRFRGADRIFRHLISIPGFFEGIGIEVPGFVIHRDPGLAVSPEAGGLDLITEVKKRVSLPIAAIAGINQSNIRLVGERQSEMACVVSAVVCAGDMAGAAAELITAFEAGKTE